MARLSPETMCTRLSLVLLVAISAHAYGSYHDGYEPQQYALEHCDPYAQTETTQIAIKWSNRPYSCKEFFRAHDVNLKWLYDWQEEGWSVYAARSVQTANAIIRGLNKILHGDGPWHDDGPMGDHHTRGAFRFHIKGVFGSCIAYTSAAKPAAVPSECAGPLPNSCPDSLRSLNTISAPTVWASLPGVVNANPTSAVMVIDSGIRPTHNDLAANLVPSLVVTGMDRTTGRPKLPVPVPLTASPYHRHGASFARHGSHVAGTIFARWNNGANTAVGVVGRALGGSCECSVSEQGLDAMCLSNCIRFASSRSVKVLALPYSSSRPKPSSASIPDQEREAIQAFCNTGGIIVTAAGNGDNKSHKSPSIGANVISPGHRIYPAAFAEDLSATNPTCIITVANLLPDGMTLSESSNYGATVAVAAPGTDITSVNSKDDSSTLSLSGTSMAAAHVAGMATLLFNAFPNATQCQVFDCIVSTATRPVVPNPRVQQQYIAGGLVNLADAYNCLRHTFSEGSDGIVCPATGLPPCVNQYSGQAVAVEVAACDPAISFCLPIPGNTRAICQYSYRPEGSLCSLNASSSAACPASTSVTQLPDVKGQQLGIVAEPFAEAFEDAASSVQLAGDLVVQRTKQSRHSRDNSMPGPEALPRGQCRSRQCIAA